eukprot:scaffold22304_cov54-Phaeocystis_antarctica.AAC.1
MHDLSARCRYRRRVRRLRRLRHLRRLRRRELRGILAPPQAVETRSPDLLHGLDRADLLLGRPALVFAQEAHGIRPRLTGDATGCLEPSRLQL